MYYTKKTHKDLGGKKVQSALLNNAGTLKVTGCVKKTCRRCVLVLVRHIVALSVCHSFLIS